MLNKIKANKPIKRVISNLTSTSDEIMSSARNTFLDSFTKANDELEAMLKAKGTKPSDILNKSKTVASYRDFAKTGALDKDYSKETASMLRNEMYKDIYRNNGSTFVNTKAIGKGVSDYYFGAGVGKEQQITRLAATGIGATGLGIGARYLSGGNMTTNRNGEKDIAMIPFL